MESTCSAKSARWSQHWVHLKCNQPVIGLRIVVTLGQSFKMGVIYNRQAHFGHSGSKHSECAQFLTITHIVDPLWRTFKMYPIFNHWVHCGQVLSVPSATIFGFPVYLWYYSRWHHLHDNYIIQHRHYHSPEASEHPLPLFNLDFQCPNFHLSVATCDFLFWTD